MKKNPSSWLFPGGIVLVFLPLLLSTFFMYRPSKNEDITFSASSTPSPSSAVSPPALPTPTPKPVPARHHITTMSHMYQKLNNCGPSSAAMAASSLGVHFDQFSAAGVLKGSNKDKNVSPEELVAFLNTQDLRAAYRVNGSPTIIEELVAQDIPVIVEQWLRKSDGELVGHYRVVRGYNKETRRFSTNDSFNGPNFSISYAQFDEWWRPFNRTYIVVYPAEKDPLVQQILGSDWDEQHNWQAATRAAEQEAATINDGYSFFNVGTSAQKSGDPLKAKTAYDKALSFSFPEHFLWYQFTLYETFLQHKEYDRVLKMTSSLLPATGELEELRYYRGKAYLELGQKEKAKQELQSAVQANPRFSAAIQALAELDE